jgi:hypothetical protein
LKTIAKSIEMISWTEENGKIHPLKFKLSQNEGENHIYKIRKIYTSELEKLAGNKIYKFTCEIVINNTIKVCELRYELDSCRWVLFKL